MQEEQTWLEAFHHAFPNPIESEKNKPITLPHKEGEEQYFRILSRMKSTED